MLYTTLSPQTLQETRLDSPPLTAKRDSKHLHNKTSYTTTRYHMICYGTEKCARIKCRHRDYQWLLSVIRNLWPARTEGIFLHSEDPNSCGISEGTHRNRECETWQPNTITFSWGSLTRIHEKGIIWEVSLWGTAKGGHRRPSDTEPHNNHTSPIKGEEQLLHTPPQESHPR